MTKTRRRIFKELLSLNGDYSGKVIYKLKRSVTVRTFLANANILNRVKPITLEDLMIRRRSQPKTLGGQLMISLRLYKRYLGYGPGSAKRFSKYFHTVSQTLRDNRTDGLVRLVICRLEYTLFQLNFFDTLRESRDYVVRHGVVVNDVLINNPNCILNPFDIFSFKNDHRQFFKTRFLCFFSTDKELEFVAKTGLRLFNQFCSHGPIFRSLYKPTNLYFDHTFFLSPDNVRLDQQRLYSFSYLSTLFETRPYSFSSLNNLVFALRYRMLGGRKIDIFKNKLTPLLSSLLQKKKQGLLVRRRFKSFKFFCARLKFFIHKQGSLSEVNLSVTSKSKKDRNDSSFFTNNDKKQTLDLDSSFIKKLFNSKPYYIGSDFSSLFFPNFLPRHIEPSFRRFEFLIKPTRLKSTDLRLASSYSTSLKEDLLFSMI